MEVPREWMRQPCKLVIWLDKHNGGSLWKKGFSFLFLLYRLCNETFYSRIMFHFLHGILSIWYAFLNHHHWNFFAELLDTGNSVANQCYLVFTQKEMNYKKEASSSRAEAKEAGRGSWTQPTKELSKAHLPKTWAALLTSLKIQEKELKQIT